MGLAKCQKAPKSKREKIFVGIYRIEKNKKATIEKAVLSRKKFFCPICCLSIQKYIFPPKNMYN